MKNPVRYCFALIGIIFLLNGCQKEEDAMPVAPQDKQNQSAVIEECLAMGKTEPSLKLAYLFKEYNNVDKDDWYPVANFDKEQKIYKGLSKWISNSAKRILLESATPSGDWLRMDEYCFNKQGGIAEVYSDLHTFYADPGAVQVIKTWKYYSDGSLESDSTEEFDLSTKKPLNPNDVTYMENLPQMISNYKDLAKFLRLPAEASS